MKGRQPGAALDPALAAALQVAIARGGPRVERIGCPAGPWLWLKRVEVLAGQKRLQKGDPRRAFEADRRGLKFLGQQGLPVVPLVAEGEDWFATADCGPSLQHLVKNAAPEAELLRAMAAAGRALRQLHLAGFAHGRLVLRDICWDGTEARFIDLERFVPGPRGPMAQAMDVVNLVQNWFTLVPGSRQGLDAALAPWAAVMDKAVQRRVVALGWLLGWIGPLTAPVRWLQPRSREFQALPLALAYLRRSAK